MSEFVEIISERYVAKVILDIYDKSLFSRVKKYDLLSVVGSGTAIDAVVRHLESTGILTIERVDKPRKVLLLELTDKGMLLGSLLAEMEDTAYLPAEHIPTRNQIRLLIALEEYEEKPSQRKLRAAVNGSRFGTKLMRDGLVEKIEQKPYMKLTDKGKKIASELKHTFESLKQT